MWVPGLQPEDGSSRSGGCGGAGWVFQVILSQVFLDRTLGIKSPGGATSRAHLHGLLHIFALLLWFQMKPELALILLTVWSWGKLLHPPARPSSSDLDETGAPHPHPPSQMSFFNPMSTFSIPKAWHTHLASRRSLPRPPAESLFRISHCLSLSSKFPQYSFLSWECSQGLNIYYAPRSEPGLSPISSHLALRRLHENRAHFTKEKTEP